MRLWSSIGGGRTKNLSRAKKTGNDEFYTRFQDITTELSHYPIEFFNDKVIYCPTDVSVNTGTTKQSQFVRYFQVNAHRLQFKRLIATCLVRHAAGDEKSEDDVQNCYVLERVVVPESQRYVWVNLSTGPEIKKVVGQYVDEIDGVVKYALEGGGSTNVPRHVIQQAVQDALGSFKIVKRFVESLRVQKANGILRIETCEEDKSRSWKFQGHTLKYAWAFKPPFGGRCPSLTDDCYVFSPELYYGDWCPFMKDEDGNPMVEEVDGGYVGLQAPAYYNYVESDYKDYERHCPALVTEESGDFKSEYCCKMLEQADVVCTNPPFSLFTDFMNWLLPSNKSILVVGNMNAVTDKDVWPYIRADKLWLGYHPLGTAMYFDVPEEDRKKLVQTKKKGQGWKEFNGVPMAAVPACWFTSVDMSKRHTPLAVTYKYADNPELYPKYDNYDAINVDKVSEIPMDYRECIKVPAEFISRCSSDKFEFVQSQSSVAQSTDRVLVCLQSDGTGVIERQAGVDLRMLAYEHFVDGFEYCSGVMGVPITFVQKYCPEQFEFVAFRRVDNSENLVFNIEREREFCRVFGFLFNGVSWSDYGSKMDVVLGRQEQIFEDRNSSEDVKFFARYILNHSDLVAQALSQRESNRLVVESEHSSCRDCEECGGCDRWQDYILEDSCETEVLSVFFPTGTRRVAGTLNGFIAGEETYRRITIRRK